MILPLNIQEENGFLIMEDFPENLHRLKSAGFFPFISYRTMKKVPTMKRKVP